MKKKKIEEKRTKRRLRIKVLLVTILIIYLLGLVIYTIFNMPIDNIYIKGNNYVTDSQIINVANITDNTRILTMSLSKITEAIKTIPLIKDVTIKRELSGDINIGITENKILFYNISNNKLVLEGNIEVEYSSKYLGIPTLINYTPNNIYDSFINELSYIDQNLISKISEIEYAPNLKEEIILDEERFIFKMNDSNTVHVNLVNFNKFSKYDDIIETLEERGTLYLDSSNDNHIFDVYDEVSDELPEESN